MALEIVEGDNKFPLVLVPSGGTTSLDDLISSIQERKAWIEEQLWAKGAILFRGFPLSDASHFSRVVEALGYNSMGYQGGAAARTRVSRVVFTANEIPLHLNIGFHNEMAYLPNYPDVIMLFCEVAPPKGSGATGIALGSPVYQRMSKEYPEFVQKLEEQGLVYFNILHEHEWKAVFKTHNKAEAEQSALELGKRLEWLPDGRVKVCHGPRPGVKLINDKYKTWFNNIGSSHNPEIPNLQYLEFGDGSPVPENAMEASLRMLSENEALVEWEKGDILMLNNHTVLHSRHPSKPPRRILVSILKNM